MFVYLVIDLAICVTLPLQKLHNLTSNCKISHAIKQHNILMLICDEPLLCASHSWCGETLVEGKEEISGRVF